MAAVDLSSYLEEPWFIDRFCDKCEARPCRVGGDISDPECCRALDYEECVEILEAAGKDLGRCVA